MRFRNLIVAILSFGFAGTTFCASSTSPHSVARDQVRNAVTITDWTDYTTTMTITATGSPPSKATSRTEQAVWRRIGDSMEINYLYGHVSSRGTNIGSGIYLFSIPDGFTINSNFINTDAAYAPVLGIASGTSQSSATLASVGFVYAYDSSHLAIAFDPASSGPVGSSFCPITSPPPVSYRFSARVPISGWGN